MKLRAKELCALDGSLPKYQMLAQLAVHARHFSHTILIDVTLGVLTNSVDVK